MKVKILAALKTKFEGVQDAILGRVADKLISGGKVAKEEDITTAVAGVTFQQVLEMYGDSRANEATTTAVSNYEKKHNLKDGKQVNEGAAGSSTEGQPVAANAGDGGGDEKVPAWANAFMAKLTAMEKRQNAIEKRRLTETRRSQFDAVVSKLPDTLRKAYQRTPIDSQSDDEFTALMADVTNEVAEIEKSNRAAGASFGRPLGNGRISTATNGGGGVEATDAEVDAVVAKLGI